MGMIESISSYALITGASKGLGKAIAITLAKRGYHLLLIARNEQELSKLEVELTNTYSIKVSYLAIDLSENDGPNKVLDWVNRNAFSVSVLVNNAGYGVWGNFKDLSLSEQLNMMQLNMQAVIAITHLILPNLVKQKHAYILNISSTAAYQAVPTFSLYAATKAFVLSFTRAIRFELKKSPVSVTCFSPGPIDTDFARRAGLNALSKMAQKFNMKPDEVASIAIKAMFNKKSEVIPGFINLISVYATRFLPKVFIEKTAAGIYKT